MAAVADKKGLKRICLSCGTRFYDLNKRPINCPSCKAEFTGDQKAKIRRAPRPVANDDEAEEPIIKDDDADIVSLDDVAATEDAGDDDDVLPVEEEIDDLEVIEEDLEVEDK